MYISFELDEAGKVAAVMRFGRTAKYLGDWHHNKGSLGDVIVQFYQSIKNSIVIIGPGLVAVMQMAEESFHDLRVEVCP